MCLRKLRTYAEEPSQDLRHLDNSDTTSVSAQRVTQADLRQVQTALDSEPDLSKPALAVSKPESLPSKDCLSVLADCIELPGQFAAIYPGTKEDYRPCRVFRPKRRPWFWCLFAGETEPHKIEPDFIEPDPRDF